MLKDEPKIQYFYKCIKVLEPKVNDKGEEIYDYPYAWHIGEQHLSENPDLSTENFKCIGTYRKAFIGNMQERINKAMQRDMMKYYAENCGRYVEHVWHTVTIEKKVGVFYFIKKWIKEKLSTLKRKQKEKKDDMWLEEQLFGPRL
jgi:hypothetical protein